MQKRVSAADGMESHHVEEASQALATSPRVSGRLTILDDGSMTEGHRNRAKGLSMGTKPWDENAAPTGRARADWDGGEEGEQVPQRTP